MAKFLLAGLTTIFLVSHLHMSTSTELAYSSPMFIEYYMVGRTFAGAHGSRLGNNTATNSKAKEMASSCANHFIEFYEGNGVRAIAYSTNDEISPLSLGAVSYFLLIELKRRKFPDRCYPFTMSRRLGLVMTPEQVCKAYAILFNTNYHYGNIYISREKSNCRLYKYTMAAAFSEE